MIAEEAVWNRIAGAQLQWATNINMELIQDIPQSLTTMEHQDELEKEKEKEKGLDSLRDSRSYLHILCNAHTFIPSKVVELQTYHKY